LSGQSTVVVDDFPALPSWLTGTISKLVFSTFLPRFKAFTKKALILELPKNSLLLSALI